MAFTLISLLWKMMTMMGRMGSSMRKFSMLKYPLVKMLTIICTDPAHWMHLNDKAVQNQRAAIISAQPLQERTFMQNEDKMAKKLRISLNKAEDVIRAQRSSRRNVDAAESALKREEALPGTRGHQTRIEAAQMLARTAQDESASVEAGISSKVRKYLQCHICATEVNDSDGQSTRCEGKFCRKRFCMDTSCQAAMVRHMRSHNKT